MIHLFSIYLFGGSASQILNQLEGVTHESALCKTIEKGEDNLGIAISSDHGTFQISVSIGPLNSRFCLTEVCFFVDKEDPISNSFAQDLLVSLSLEPHFCIVYHQLDKERFLARSAGNRLGTYVEGFGVVFSPGEFDDWLKPGNV